MSINVTLSEYFGPYENHHDVTDDVRSNAEALLSRVNALYAVAVRDGVPLPDNPGTKSGVSGSGNGGFRPNLCPVGAGSSTHKIGRGIDRYDPSRAFAAWCLAHPDVLKEFGLYMEDPRWTPSWVHLQDKAPNSGKLVYVPSTAPALAANPPVWTGRVVV